MRPMEQPRALVHRPDRYRRRCRCPSHTRRICYSLLAQMRRSKPRQFHEPTSAHHIGYSNTVAADSAHQSQKAECLDSTQLDQPGPEVPCPLSGCRPDQLDDGIGAKRNERNSSEPHRQVIRRVLSAITPDSRAVTALREGAQAACRIARTVAIPRSWRRRRLSAEIC